MTNILRPLWYVPSQRSGREVEFRDADDEPAKTQSWPIKVLCMMSSGTLFRM